jgi:hypothetical protein
MISLGEVKQLSVLGMEKSLSIQEMFREPLSPQSLNESEEFPKATDCGGCKSLGHCMAHNKLCGDREESQAETKRQPQRPGDIRQMLSGEESAIDSLSG